MRSPHTVTREEPPLTTTRESPCAATKTQCSQKEGGKNRERNIWNVLEVREERQGTPKCPEEEVASEDEGKQCLWNSHPTPATWHVNCSQQPYYHPYFTDEKDWCSQRCFKGVKPGSAPRLVSRVGPGHRPGRVLPMPMTSALLSQAVGSWVSLVWIVTN